LKLNIPTVAYFSMEIALRHDIPTYSGGLGVLAGDTLRSAADLGVPMYAFTLVYHKGYFRQRLDGAGNQREEAQTWSPAAMLERVSAKCEVTIDGRPVSVGAWKFDVKGVRGEVVPVFLLDTNQPENSDYDRTLTDQLYGGDPYYRLCQEVVLGIGGVHLLRKLSIDVQSYHMNEGHSALLTLPILDRSMGMRFSPRVRPADLENVRHRCIFTTHTPVPAGHDQFPRELAAQVLGQDRIDLLDQAPEVWQKGKLNMTSLALYFSRFVNGVAMRHGEVSRGMFPNYSISAITNGVHAVTWTSPHMAALFDRYVPAWRRDNNYLRYAISIPLEEIREAHTAAKRELFAEIQRTTGVQLDEKLLTIGFARRASTYKRGDLLFTNPERLRKIAHEVGPIQLVYGGKAHPHDEGGKAIIRNIISSGRALADALKVVYVENYDWDWGQRMTGGVDIWLNTPRRPEEASGTSGMKAAINGVPSFSILDGWWVEGHIEGVTGWSIGDTEISPDPTAELEMLYDKLERVIAPLYYGSPHGFTRVRRSTIALNGTFFNTQRMVQQYISNAYLPGEVLVPADVTPGVD
jgi:glycogen phosphorylase